MLCASFNEISKSVIFHIKFGTFFSFFSFFIKSWGNGLALLMYGRVLK